MIFSIIIQNLINLISKFEMAGLSQGGWGAGAPVFGKSVNPITTRGGTLSLPSNTSPPGFSDLATALIQVVYFDTLLFYWHRNKM